MFWQSVGFVTLLVFFFVAYVATRFLVKLRREKKRTDEIKASRVGESRQVRRARERAEGK